MGAEVLPRLDELAPISLAELETTAGLRTRVDSKYILTWPQATRLLDELTATHRALEIESRRAFAYRSVYFDSPSLGAYRAHVQQRRRRYKCRTRHYLDSGVHMFEVKLKGRRGITIKHQLPISPPESHRLGAAALAFAAARVTEAYGRAPEDLGPALRTRYTRITLVHADERVTLDFDLTFDDPAGRAGRLLPGYVIAESKSLHGRSAADLALKRHGLRALECSKYCAGVALLRDDVPSNPLRWLLKRYFTAASLDPAIHVA